MKKMNTMLGMYLLLPLTSAFAMDDKREGPPIRLPVHDPLNNYKETSNRSLLGLLTPRSRAAFNKKKKSEAGKLECILYYCLCLPLCYACCKPDEESYRAF
jgi:hypothetical protein